MDFNSAFDLNKVRAQLSQALQDVRDQVEKTVREDWSRSKEEAKQLGRGLRKLSEDVTTEFKVTGRQIQAHLVSAEFESHLDEMMRNLGLEEKYRSSSKFSSASEETEFANVNGSLGSDPIDMADPFRPETEDLGGRKDRIREKLAFLYHHHCEDVLETAKKGAFLGSILGPKTALKFAVIAGSLKLGLILGGVTYDVLIKPNGEWSVSRD